MTPSYTYLHTRFDVSKTRVGRCNHCATRPAYAWLADTGMRLDDGVRCPRCKHVLDKTSRSAHHMRAFTAEETAAEHAHVMARWVAKAAEDRAMAEACKADTDHSAEWGEFMAERYEAYAAAADKVVARLAKGRLETT